MYVKDQKIPTKFNIIINLVSVVKILEWIANYFQQVHTLKSLFTISESFEIQTRLIHFVTKGKDGYALTNPEF